MNKANHGLCLVAAILLSACDGGRPASVNTDDYYADPALSVQQILLAEEEEGNPREVRLFIPEASGRYPLLQFQHGFTSDVDTYTELLARVAGYGYVIAAPQIYSGDPSSAPSVPDETQVAVEVLAWVQSDVNRVLSERLEDHQVSINPGDTGLMGHSRGGQVIWRMLFDHRINARAVAGIDPVDGDAPPFPPGGTGEMVTDDEGAFNFPFPSLILGMGLGATGVPGFECAPSNRNYTHFYNASAPPKFEVVADDYGHSDMINGNFPNPLCFGAVDGSNATLRQFIAGQLAAYFDAVLLGAGSLHWLSDSSLAPVSMTIRTE